jgi:hypothetical protein
MDLTAGCGQHYQDTSSIINVKHLIATDLLFELAALFTQPTIAPMI